MFNQAHQAHLARETQFIYDIGYYVILVLGFTIVLPVMEVWELYSIRTT